MNVIAGRRNIKEKSVKYRKIPIASQGPASVPKKCVNTSSIIIKRAPGKNIATQMVSNTSNTKAINNTQANPNGAKRTLAILSVVLTGF